jgi:hypothetical protein
MMAGSAAEGGVPAQPYLHLSLYAAGQSHCHSMQSFSSMLPTIVGIVAEWLAHWLTNYNSSYTALCIKLLPLRSPLSQVALR